MCSWTRQELWPLLTAKLPCRKGAGYTCMYFPRLHAQSQRLLYVIICLHCQSPYSFLNGYPVAYIKLRIANANDLGTLGGLSNVKTVQYSKRVSICLASISTGGVYMLVPCSCSISKSSSVYAAGWCIYTGRLLRKGRAALATYYHWTLVIPWLPNWHCQKHVRGYGIPRKGALSAVPVVYLLSVIMGDMMLWISLSETRRSHVFCMMLSKEASCKR